MNKIKTPRIVNLRDIKPNSKNISMIHLDKNQWGKLKCNLKPVKVNSLPKRGVKLEFIPDPDGGVTMYPQCDSGPDTICMVVTRWTPQGVRMECRCRPARGGGNGGGGGIGGVTPPAKKKCSLLLFGNKLQCLSFSFPPCTDCKFAQLNFHGRIFIFCTCG